MAKFINLTNVRLYEAEEDAPNRQCMVRLASINAVYNNYTSPTTVMLGCGAEFTTDTAFSDIVNALNSEG